MPALTGTLSSISTSGATCAEAGGTRKAWFSPYENIDWALTTVTGKEVTALVMVPSNVFIELDYDSESSTFSAERTPSSGGYPYTVGGMRYPGHLPARTEALDELIANCDGVLIVETASGQRRLLGAEHLSSEWSRARRPARVVSHIDTAGVVGSEDDQDRDELAMMAMHIRSAMFLQDGITIPV